jgi:hypothetical protein
VKFGVLRNEGKRGYLIANAFPRAATSRGRRADVSCVFRRLAEECGSIRGSEGCRVPRDLETASQRRSDATNSQAQQFRVGKRANGGENRRPQHTRRQPTSRPDQKRTPSAAARSATRASYRAKDRRTPWLVACSTPNPQQKAVQSNNRPGLSNPRLHEEKNQCGIPG